MKVVGFLGKRVVLQGFHTYRPASATYKAGRLRDIVNHKDNPSHLGFFQMTKQETNKHST